MKNRLEEIRTTKGIKQDELAKAPNYQFTGKREI